MIRKRTTKVFGMILALAGLVSGVSLFASQAQAETADFRLRVSPTVMHLDLKPGQTIEKTFEVTNTGAQTFRFATDIAPYSVKGRDYVADFESDTNYTELSNWIALSDDGGTLAPGESLKITAKITVPKDAVSGGQYATFLAQFVGSGDSDVASQSTEALIYATVDGELSEAGKILENKITGFLFSSPVFATSSVENTGNIHQNATYILEVRSLLGQDVLYSNADTPATQTVLPETTYSHAATWNGAPQLGIFRVKQIVEFAGEVTEAEKLVILCPVWLLFITILVLICAIFWIIGRAGNSKNRHSKLIKEEEE